MSEILLEDQQRWLTLFLDDPAAIAQLPNYPKRTLEVMGAILATLQQQAGLEASRDYWWQTAMDATAALQALQAELGKLKAAVRALDPLWEEQGRMGCLFCRVELATPTDLTAPFPHGPACVHAWLAREAGAGGKGEGGNNAD